MIMIIITIIIIKNNSFYIAQQSTLRVLERTDQRNISIQSLARAHTHILRNHLDRSWLWTRKTMEHYFLYEL